MDNTQRASANEDAFLSANVDWVYPNLSKQSIWMVRSVAHEINNFLGAVVGYAELIRYQCPDEKQLEPSVSGILAICDQMEDYSRRLRLIAHPNMELLRDVDMHTFLREKIPAWRDTLIPANVSFATAFTASTAVTKGNIFFLEMLLQDLLGNAVDAMPDGGMLRLATTQVYLSGDDDEVVNHSLAEGPYLEIRIIDTGRGMDAELLQTCFEPFMTENKPRRSRGLGLSIAAVVAHAHGGGLSVSSVEGEGTVVRLLLPQERDAYAPPVSAAKRHILLVEDEDVLREITQEILESSGYSVSVAKTPEQALALFQVGHARMDLIFLDYHLPGMNAPELLEKMKAISPDIVAVIASGDDKTNDHAKLEALGVRGIIKKPYGAQKLQAFLRGIVSDTETE